MATSKDPSASPTAAKAPAKPGCLVVEVFWRTSERAPLHKMVCWTAMLTNSRAWTIIEQIRSLLSAAGLGRHQDLTASVEEAQREMGLARLKESLLLRARMVSFLRGSKLLRAVWQRRADAEEKR